MQIKERSRALVVTEQPRKTKQRKQTSIRFVPSEPTLKIDLPTEKGKLEVVSEIPRAHRDSPLMSSEMWKAITVVLDAAEENGVAPFESIIKITPKNYPEFNVYKDPAITVMSALRKAIRQRKLRNVIEVVVRGDVLYVAGIGVEP